MGKKRPFKNNNIYEPLTGDILVTGKTFEHWEDTGNLIRLSVWQP